jgi:hypothetical protein
MKSRPCTGGVPDVVQDETHRETETSQAAKRSAAFYRTRRAPERAC